MQLKQSSVRAPRAALLVTVLAMLVAACSASPAGGGASSAPSAPDASEPMGSSATPRPDATSDGSTPDATADGSPAPLTSDPLHAVRLVDVRTGEEVTLGQLAAEKPLLVETMAIWCSNCRAQQHNVVAAHNQADFHSLSLDVDPGEQPADLATYADREGFDWHFAMADADTLAMLRERFGTAVAVPPAMPKVLFRPDGSIELIGLGELLTAQQIADAVSG